MRSLVWWGIVLALRGEKEAGRNQAMSKVLGGVPLYSNMNAQRSIAKTARQKYGSPTKTPVRETTGNIWMR